jgi:class 3 adenylate cyclase
VPETRNLAVAFADIASSTRIYRELGDMAASAVANAFCTRVAELVPRFEGRLVKTLGDEVMSVFAGAEEAVGAMSALHREIAAAPPGGHALQLHTGIDYGPVVVEGADLYGTIVNTAAYLAATGRAEQILTTQAVVDGLSPASVPLARPIYTTRLKGHDHDSLIYEVIWQVDPGELTNRNPARLQYVPPDEGALLLSCRDVTVAVNRQHPRVHFGRDRSNDLVLVDPFVSRRHAFIELDAIRFRLVDESANGTFVAFDGFADELHLLRGETLLHGSGRISLGRSFADPLAAPITFRRDKRALYRV